MTWSPSERDNSIIDHHHHPIVHREYRFSCLHHVSPTSAVGVHRVAATGLLASSRRKIFEHGSGRESWTMRKGDKRTYVICHREYNVVNCFTPPGRYGHVANFCQPEAHSPEPLRKPGFRHARREVACIHTHWLVSKFLLTAVGRLPCVLSITAAVH